MGNKQGTIEITREGVLKIKTEYLKEEFYRKPDQSRIRNTPSDLWGMGGNEAQYHIHPMIKQKRESST